MKILLAEDDKRLGKLMVYKLTKEYGTVDWVQDGESAFDYANSSKYDVIILDWMMPKMDGITVSEKLRKQGYQGAILMLTAKGEVEDRVKGLDAGSDDYLTKPFEFSELIARLRALARRQSQLYQHTTIIVQDLTINSANHSVLKNGLPLELTPREYQMLTLLARHAGQVLSKEWMIDSIWGIDQFITTNTIEAFIGSLRKKLDDLYPKKYIQTIRGIGYMMVKGND